MKKLLVGSIFADGSDCQKKWFDLQSKFLYATTKDFDHVVVLNKLDIQPDYFNQRAATIYPNGKNCKNSGAHVRGLNSLLGYFMAHISDYEAFLFLDSDAFPIREGWQDMLSMCMLSKFDIAIPIRFENLENRLHSSILFAKSKALPNLVFRLQDVGGDLVGGKEADVGCGAYQKELRSKVFPLLRSNRTNVHPLTSGIYYDMFYHHCCGSGRKYNMRARNYWQHIADPKPNFTEKLFEDPNYFISELGWPHVSYARISQ